MRKILSYVLFELLCVITFLRALVPCEFQSLLCSLVCWWASLHLHVGGDRNLQGTEVPFESYQHLAHIVKANLACYPRNCRYDWEFSLL